MINSDTSTGSKRLTQFILSVSNSSIEKADCGGVYTDTVPEGGNVTIQCGHVGRYVHFMRRGGLETNLVTLCEVEVFGHLYTGKRVVFICYIQLSFHVFDFFALHHPITCDVINLLLHLTCSWYQLRINL